MAEKAPKPEANLIKAGTSKARKHPVTDVLAIIFACALLATVANSLHPGTWSSGLFAVLSVVCVGLYFWKPTPSK